ncbi:SLC13 family permease [Geobacillus kaustophilus NBRC 102445]|uniref:SLC13 family permease n=1 Tax=Geobacillus thermoleovorans group TaxID=1505648 RepID=UPI0010BF5DF5|nr:SLC13 family permease [Geobacillus kaustophilus]MED4972302.1 SLC13 family permease [Geobacillus thermoleovorans]QCK81222.1 SLC13 family permease [Geobacillus kaustophilus NBRC 102445]
MTFKIGFVLFMIALMMGGLMLEVARPDMIVFAVLTVFLLTGIITEEEALEGFSNEGTLTVALLFIVAGAIQKSGIIERSLIKRLKKGKTIAGTMAKIFLPVSGFSAFLNNTPIVAALTPILRKWCEENKIPPSKFLIPLSYMTVLGGTITLMGTSTNLVVQGLMLKQGMEGFSLFELGIVGVPITIAGLVYLITIGYRLLPNNKSIKETVQEHSREYLAEMVVGSDFPYLNQTVQVAGLRQLKGLYLIEIIRGNEKISPVKATTKIQKGDRLIFTGLVSTIAELQQIKGLTLETGTDLSLDTLKNGNTQLVEAVVSHHSSLLDKTIKQAQFRSKYDAAVIAVHRNQERIQSKIGDIVLKPGDTLLLLCGSDFMNKFKQSNDFYVVTPLDTPVALQEDKKKGWIAIGILLAMILLVTFGVLSMFKAMSLAVVLLLLMKVITPADAKQSIQFDVLLLIASSFGIGTAVLKTGTAEWIADGLLKIAQPLGVIAVLFFVYLLTNIFTELLSNSAAAVLMFPIAMEIAEKMSINSTGLAVLIAIAASAAFITPIGYQTHLIVYGPGGYRFMDYVKVGTPLNIIVMIITVWIVYLVWIS